MNTLTSRSQGVICLGVVLALTAVQAIAGETAVSKQANPSYSSFERSLIDMPADSWMQAPDTRMVDVCAPERFGVRAVMGCRAIIDAWGGGAYGRSPRMMFIWGGGHNDYWGNEVYGFDLRSGTWKRLTDPTPGDVVKASGTDPLPDGNPNSRHTYDGLQYLEHSDRLFAQGGSISPGGGGTSVTWLFDPKSLVWHNGGREDRPGGYGIASAYDPERRAVIARTSKALWSYDAESGNWTRLAGFGSRPLWPRYEVRRNKSGAIDARRRLFWSVGSNDFLVWDIDRKRMVSDDWKTAGGGDYTNARRVKKHADQLFESGGGAIYDAQAPGFDYDLKADQMVAWKGGAPYILDLATKSWHTGSAAGAPEAQPRNGTFGRWRYLPEYNVFMLVNSVNANVYFYKNTPGGP